MYLFFLLHTSELVPSSNIDKLKFIKRNSRITRDYSHKVNFSRLYPLFLKYPDLLTIKICNTSVPKVYNVCIEYSEETDFLFSLEGNSGGSI